MFTTFPAYILYLGIILGLFSFYIGGDSFLDNLIVFGKSRKVSNVNIGLFLVSFGTVVDELGVVLFSSIRLHGEISFGTIQGSNIFTLILMIGVILAMKRTIGRHFLLDLIVLAVPLATLIILDYFYTIIPPFVGAFFIVLFAVYLGYSARRNAAPAENIATHTDIISIFLALVLIGSASYAVVHYITILSDQLHIGFFLASFLIVGIAGSLPEIFTIMLSLKKKVWQMTVGIAVGSSIYKGVLLLGIAILSSRISLKPGLYTVYAMLVLTIVLIALTLPGQMKRTPA